MIWHSMTGFGRGAVSDANAGISVELNSVNRKQLEINCSLPGVFVSYEERLREVLRARLHRGAVRVQISVQWPPSVLQESIRLDEQLAAAWVTRINRTASAVGLQPLRGAEALFKMPDIFARSEPALPAEVLEPLLMRAFGEAVSALVDARAREGNALRVDVTARIDELFELLAHIETCAPEVPRLWREKLLQRIASWKLEAPDWDEERMAREVFLFADKADISEECVRVRTHLGRLLTLDGAAGSIGRTLDFTLQELMREWNTMGAKVQDAALVHRIVDAKSITEKIREQVQNIE